MPIPEKLSIVIFRSKTSRWWIGVCLERYLVSQARTKRKIIEEMLRIIEAAVLVSAEHGKPDISMFPTAPGRYQEMRGRKGSTFADGESWVLDFGFRFGAEIEELRGKQIFITFYECESL